MVVRVPVGAGDPVLSPVQGELWVTSERYGVIVAHTADGCRWTLAVQANTAELDPSTQTCQLASGTVTLLFWAAASDGDHQNAVMAGITDVNGQESNFYLYIAALTKAASPGWIGPMSAHHTAVPSRQRLGRDHQARPSGLGRRRLSAASSARSWGWS
jgi:hypothetical protein